MALGEDTLVERSGVMLLPNPVTVNGTEVLTAHRSSPQPHQSHPPLRALHRLVTKTNEIFEALSERVIGALSLSTMRD